MMIQGMGEGRNIYNNGVCHLWQQWKAGFTDVSLTMLAMLKVGNLSLTLSSHTRGHAFSVPLA